MASRRNPSGHNRDSGELSTQSGRSEFLLRQETHHFSGPLPHPSVLAKYNEVIPNGAERIMAMAERQSAHRERIEARVVDGNVASQTRGSYFAFIILIVTILGGFFCLYEGKNIVGLSTIIGSLGGVVGVFFYSKREQRKERVEKAEGTPKTRKKT